jgi:hypothetical protein
VVAESARQASAGLAASEEQPVGRPEHSRGGRRQGAMLQCRRALKPDGLFLSALWGGNTLQVRADRDRAGHSLGDLLTRSWRLRLFSGLPTRDGVRGCPSARRLGQPRAGNAAMPPGGAC